MATSAKGYWPVGVTVEDRIRQREKKAAGAFRGKHWMDDLHWSEIDRKLSSRTDKRLN